MEFPNIDESNNVYNNSPQDKFSGLSPCQTYEIINNPFSENSPIKFTNNIDNNILDRIPFFKITEELLKIIQRDKFIKLTPLGALLKKVMVELYDYKFIPDERIESGLTKLWKQDDCISIGTARIVSELGKFVKKINGKLYLTKSGEEHLKPENRLNLFKYTYSVFTESFNWSFNDGYPKEPIGQYGSTFSVYLLLKYGEEENSTLFYSNKYLSVFGNFLPLFENDYSTAQQQFNNCYSVRTFERFTNWFGLSFYSEKRNYFDIQNSIVKSTDLLKEIFYLE